ncbi:MAG: endonuclease MutS2 [Streptococcaceae bacterium]|jgi:DNA mismatch repair protein MutS2|nr:endonuclease MutS2 [Streptococcaceae bacterium]
MNHKIEEILEFDLIRELLGEYTLTFQGGLQARTLHPTADLAILELLFAKLGELELVLREKSHLPIAELPDLEGHFKRVEIGADLSGLELSQIARLLRITNTLNQFFEQLDLSVPHLTELLDKTVGLPQVRKDLSVIDEIGYLRDEASAALANHRRTIKRLERQIRETLEQYTKRSANYLSEPIITIRNERYVLPVKHEYRNQFGGVVHDQSASGQTLYIEPAKTLELNNQLSSAKSNERSEINRILHQLSIELKPYLHDLRQNAWVIGHLDFIQAKALFAKALNAFIPEISTKQSILLLDARHPLIDPNAVVANTIELGVKYRSMVITGPNTGGKTITLKTLGLLQLMAQSGLAIPANLGSQIAVLDEIFADIGDEQSIAQNLSTFSSHMTHIVEILKKTNERTLVLFDELGAGTDPQEGAALAIAILEFLRKQCALVIATTHYPELKIYGVNTPQTINASMAFDVATLSPTYQLLIGIPGKSNAFEISKRLGLPEAIIAVAKQMVGTKSQEINQMLDALEATNTEMSSSLEEIRQFKSENAALNRQLSQQQQAFDDEKAALLAKADEEAQAIIRKAEEESEKIIKALREKNYAKEHELIAAKSQLKALKDTGVDLSKNKVLRRAKAKKALRVGDEVLVLSYGQRAVVTKKLTDTRFEVQMGLIKMKADLAELEKVDKSEVKSVQPTVKRVRHGATYGGVKTELDLRGKRYEEAMHEVDRYIDAALLQNYPHVRIIHGKGTGALQQGVWQYLKQNRQVKHFAFATPSAGGNGVTIVEFK